ncbi:hypothetical protein F2Q68_00026929 [Brassica cretica]|uniref:Uncharacterized protein n=1 Tax=Brassica cretica TaxID=69181 RepID=A0A8S9IHA8_BRACR|nr:hypothetical protein F2Q68_00026929 [Brassica cretica]
MKFSTSSLRSTCHGVVGERRVRRRNHPAALPILSLSAKSTTISPFLRPAIQSNSKAGLARYNYDTHPLNLEIVAHGVYWFEICEEKTIVDNGWNLFSTHATNVLPQYMLIAS